MEKLPEPREWMTQLREAKCLSERQLAKEAEVSNVYISLIEKGERTPSPDIAMRIGGALGLSPEESLNKFFIRVA